MRDDVERMRRRTLDFALRIVRMYRALPASKVADAIGYQVFRAGTSVGAQYREACRSRSDAEIISKLESTLQELDETSYWLELLVEADVILKRRLSSLMKEADELTRMLVSAVKNIKSRKR
jgi:four helix bundle protein